MLTRLVILWLLSEMPHHGYRIKQILSDSALNFWFPIEYASIYSMLRSLVKDGYAQKILTEQSGKRPQRTMFAITDQGRKHYEQLLREAWLTTTSYSDPIQVALAAGGDLADSELKELSVERQRRLKSQLKRIEEFRSSAPDPAMVDRETARLKGELTWIRTWISTNF